MPESRFWRLKLRPYTVKSNAIGGRQVLLTLVPFMLLWAGYAQLVETSRYVAIPFAIVISLFLLRAFVLMHDCGHGSLFASQRANQVLGFLAGVMTGMPQFVWSKNHSYHHSTNGDWVKYGGVFNIASTDRYARMTDKEKTRYWLYRHPMILIPGGFLYVVFNPRFNWMAGNISMLAKLLRPLLRLNVSESIAIAKKWETKYWKGRKDYVHMTYNNVALLSIWFLMCRAIGASEFFLLYVISTSLAGSVGILIFTIQHNFEGAYATDTARVNAQQAALEGTSMLILPRVLNWFTADIAYHHLHHLSVSIPNYRLAACHREFASVFADVKRVHCRDLLGTFRFQLWDPELQQIVARDTVDQALAMSATERKLVKARCERAACSGPACENSWGPRLGDGAVRRARRGALAQHPVSTSRSAAYAGMSANVERDRPQGVDSTATSLPCGTLRGDPVVAGKS